MSLSSRRVIITLVFWIAVLAVPLLSFRFGLGKELLFGRELLKYGVAVFAGATLGLLPWAFLLYRRQGNTAVGLATCATLVALLATLPRGLLTFLLGMWPISAVAAVGTFAALYVAGGRAERLAQAEARARLDAGEEDENRLR
ncbi:hypothetical protein [Gemmatimonas aurantiaca]|uniref:hypothetical protein n=1 Tax=Gemmatimonas aurantiaca TaxID=173480 RepID=UPI00301DDC45